MTAQSPLIDVQSAAQTRAVTPEIIKSVPIGGTMYQLAAMMPGVSIVGGAAVVDVGGASGSPVQAQLSSHGSATGDEVQLLDGLRIGNMMGGSRTNVSLAPLIYEQVDVQISGQGGDSTTIGVTSNAVPRSGGNTFAGTFLANGSNSNLQSDNLTDRLKATGLTATSSLKNMFDINAAHRGADRERPRSGSSRPAAIRPTRATSRACISRSIRRPSSASKTSRSRASTTSTSGTSRRGSRPRSRRRCA